MDPQYWVIAGTCSTLHLNQTRENYKIGPPSVPWEGMVELSRSDADVAALYQLLGVKSDEFVYSPHGFVSPSDDSVSSSDDFVSWPGSSVSAIDVPVTDFHALSGLQAPVTDFDAITGSEASVIDSYTPDCGGPGLELKKIVDDMLIPPHRASLGSLPTSRLMRQVKPKLADVDDPDDE